MLFGLNHWLEDPLPQERLLEIAATVGADVPFCLLGGTMLAEGFGERLRPIPSMPDCFLVLVHAGEKDSTGGMYARFDRLAQRPAERTDRMVEALQQGELTGVAHALGNAFHGLSNEEQGERAGQILKQAGALGCCLSGSGPTVYGVFEDEMSAHRGMERCIHAGFAAHLCRPIVHGCYVAEENFVCSRAMRG